MCARTIFNDPIAALHIPGYKQQSVHRHLSTSFSHYALPYWLQKQTFLICSAKPININTTNEEDAWPNPPIPRSNFIMPFD